MIKTTHLFVQKKAESACWRSSSLSYLITFQGGSHQDNWPHGGNHVIWRNMLSLEVQKHRESECKWRNALTSASTNPEKDVEIKDFKQLLLRQNCELKIK